MKTKLFHTFSSHQFIWEQPPERIHGPILAETESEKDIASLDEKLSKTINIKDAYEKEKPGVVAAVAESTKNPKLIEYFVSHENIAYRGAVAQNPNLPKPLQEKLLNDKDEYVRGLLAANKSLSPDMLARLAKDKDSHVRRNVAANPNTQTETLETLAYDKDAAYEVSVHPNASAAAKETAESMIEGDYKEFKKQEEKREREGKATAKKIEGMLQDKPEFMLGMLFRSIDLPNLQALAQYTENDKILNALLKEKNNLSDGILKPLASNPKVDEKTSMELMEEFESKI